jgi:hypothetical protein
MITFVYDPIKAAIKAAQNVFPKIKAEVQFNPELGMPGCTIINKGSVSTIDIDSNIAFSAAIEQLIHEFAHVVTGTEEDHPKEWKEAQRKIYNEYSAIVEKELSNYEA